MRKIMKKKKIINFGNYLKKINKRRSFICGIKSHKLNKNEIIFLKKYKPWGVILFTRNIKNIQQTQNLTRSIKKIFNDKNYPIIIDEEGGRVSRLKNIIDSSNLTSEYFGKLYKKNRPKFRLYMDVYINQISYLLNVLGININSVPVLDLFRKNSHEIIGDRAYSQNPVDVSKIGDKIIDGFNRNNILTIIKHIPGHGLAMKDSHKELPIINKNFDYLLKKDFKPFMNKKSSLAMTAHILLKKIDKNNCVTHSKKIIKMIRKSIGYKNIIITDDISMKALKFNIEVNTKMSFNAGCNLVLHCNGNLNQMTKVAKNSPLLNDFLIKKTSQMIIKLS